MTEHTSKDTFNQAGSQQSGAADSVRQATGDAVNTATAKVKETAGTVADQAKQTAGAVADQAKQTLNDATRQTKSEISNVTSQVRQQADSLVSEQKDMAAQRLGTLASTLRQTSRQLQDEDEGTMGHYAEVIADQVDSFSGFLRDRNPGDLLGDIQRLARQQPELFVAGSLAVGFLIGRFIKGPSRSGLRQSDANPSYYGQGGYQSGYQGSGYLGSSYQGGAYGIGGYQPGGYRGSDNPAEGADTFGQSAGYRAGTYQGRYESSGIQGNAYQQGGMESSGYQAEGADRDEGEAGRIHTSSDYEEGYEGGRSAYETGPTMTEGSDTDYPRYDPTFGAGKEGGDENSGDTSYTPASRR